MTMPFEGRPAFQFFFIFLIVPAQYLITIYLNTSDQKSSIGRSYLFSRLNLVSDYFLDVTNYILNFANPKIKEQVTENDLKQKSHYFASSPVTRSPRPSNVKFRVGQVIKHKIFGYRGVIIGWDSSTKAPEFWIKNMYTKETEHLIQNPAYLILVDFRYEDHLFTTYANQNNLEVLINSQVINPEIDQHFERFDGQKYIPRPKLQRIYPHD